MGNSSLSHVSLASFPRESLYLSFRLLDSHFEFDVNNVVPVPAKQMLHQNQRLVEEIGKENESEMLVHLLDRLLHVSFVVSAVHVESEMPGLERKRAV